MSSKKIRIAILFGGKSAEHEVSIQSAATIAQALNKRRYEVIPIFITRGGDWILQTSPACQLESAFKPSPKDLSRGKPAHVFPSFSGKLLVLDASGCARYKKVDVVFPALHGPMGEDGTVQGLLELAGIPYVGCGVLSSSIGMDKEISKRLAAAAGVPVLPHVFISQTDFPQFDKWLKPCVRLGFPLFVKPAGLGSSVGIGKVFTADELKRCVRNAFRYDTRVIVEKGIDRAREIVCAILGDDAYADVSVCGEVSPKGRHEFYDYDAKYTDPEGIDLTIPADIPERESSKIRDMAVKIFRALNGYGMARVDFFLNPRRGRAWQPVAFFCEMNTIPGFTSHSLYPRLWESGGLPLARLLDKLVGLALKRQSSRSKLQTAIKKY